ncbi:MAG: CPBP family intramembrane metalloprotease [Chloroflexota bacterium]|nr:CPBP family intramembrane metalloprotease [Chloroflexota bacterium]
MGVGPVSAEPVGRRTSVGGAAGRLIARLSQAPAYLATAGDLATVSVLGLRLPARASVAIAVATLVVLLDHAHDVLPRAGISGREPGDMRAAALERVVLFGLVALVTIVAVFRDDPRRYGLRLGSWRLGLGLALAGCLLMTPIVLVVARIPEIQAFYAPAAAPLPDLLVTHALDLASAEFLFRGFLMFALLRTVGPIAVLVATFPFVMTHLGKPEVETLSTIGGGLVFGWIDWRTGSILWSVLFHAWILTLVIVAAAATG